MEDQESLTSSLLSNHTPVDDIDEIKGCRSFATAFCRESKKLWYLAGPAIFTSICQYSLGAITQTFAGHISDVALSAFSIENSVIAGLSFGIMMGMGSALETLCGQAYGAGQHHMLGVYMQRSWIILISTALVMSLVYIFATPFLKLIGQEAEIADLAGKLALWMLPQLFAYAANFPLAKFLQAQSKVMAMSVISGIALVFHVVLSWALIFKAGWGLAGAAVALNLSWWLNVLCQAGYIMLGGRFKESWKGFSMAAFGNLGAFMRLSLASGVMLCLETWYFYLLILLAGYLKHPQIAVDAISICTNIVGWEVMISIGFNVAISVRVSNELGAGHPRAAKLAVAVVVSTTFLIGCVLMVLILLTSNTFPTLFTSSEEVRIAASDLAILLALTMLLDSVQPVLSGVAVGAGWQALIAYINLGCYYIFGLPLGCLFGYYFDWGVKGIWLGMIIGTVLQTIILSVITYRTKWNEEASQAKARISKWGEKV